MTLACSNRSHFLESGGAAELEGHGGVGVGDKVGVSGHGDGAGLSADPGKDVYDRVIEAGLVGSDDDGVGSRAARDCGVCDNNLEGSWDCSRVIIYGNRHGVSSGVGSCILDTCR